VSNFSCSEIITDTPSVFTLRFVQVVQAFGQLQKLSQTIQLLSVYSTSVLVNSGYLGLIIGLLACNWHLSARGRVRTADIYFGL